MFRTHITTSFLSSFCRCFLPYSTLHMTMTTPNVKTFSFRNGHGTHLWMKVGTFLAQIASLVCFGAIVHQFSASLWMKEFASLTFHTMFTIVVYVVFAGLFLWKRSRLIFVLQLTYSKNYNIRIDV